MSSKKGNIIELFVDKAALVIAGLVAIVILFTYVIGNTSSIEYAGQKFGPKEIDNFINNNAKQLREKLQQDPNTASRYESQKPQYLSLLKDPIGQTVDTKIGFPLPGYVDKTKISQNRKYRIPQAPLIDKPIVAVVRMAAFVPIEELTSAIPYKESETKLEDVDLVTVESSVDVKQLYSEFRESFAGRDLPAEWRSEQYAKPVFAKIELQRKTLQSDGSWSDWVEIPRTQICNLRKELQIPQKVGEYEMEIALVQFAKPEFREEILQPPVYYNAIPTEKWISPSFYNEREKTIAKQREENRRLEIEAEKARKLQERAAPSTRQPPAVQPTRQPPARQPVRGGREAIPSMPGEGSSRVPPPATTTRTIERPNVRNERVLPSQDQAQSLSEESKYAAIRLTPDTNPAELEKLVFWAHDDTTKPGEKYQYRIRIGIFNPVAGKGWVSEDQNDLRDQIVLWSNFASVDEVVEIPQRLVFFATGIREIEKSTNVDRTVEVLVAKYTLGNWISHTFSVKNGEEIGKPVEAAGDLRLEKMGINSDIIDYSTGAVMVDVQKVTEWVGVGYLRSREYSELLYSSDGKTIEKMAIKERYWPAKITKIYKEISESLAVEPVTLLAWSQVVLGSGQPMQQQYRSTPSTPSPEYTPPAGDNPRLPPPAGDNPRLPPGGLGG